MKCDNLEVIEALRPGVMGSYPAQADVREMSAEVTCSYKV